MVYKSKSRSSGFLIITICVKNRQCSNHQSWKCRFYRIYRKQWRNLFYLTKEIYLFILNKCVFSIGSSKSSLNISRIILAAERNSKSFHLVSIFMPVCLLKLELLLHCSHIKEKDRFLLLLLKFQSWINPVNMIKCRLPFHNLKGLFFGIKMIWIRNLIIQ